MAYIFRPASEDLGVKWTVRFPSDTLAEILVEKLDGPVGDVAYACSMMFPVGIDVEELVDQTLLYIKRQHKITVLSDLLRLTAALIVGHIKLVVP